MTSHGKADRSIFYLSIYGMYVGLSFFYRLMCIPALIFVILYAWEVNK